VGKPKSARPPDPVSASKMSSRFFLPVVFTLLTRLMSGKHWAPNRGCTQAERAERLGIERSYISDMERGKKNVCLPTMEVLAQGLETTISRLLSGL
jgi:DNA-binding XRE family transcriptional regulator